MTLRFATSYCVVLLLLAGLTCAQCVACAADADVSQTNELRLTFSFTNATPCATFSALMNNDSLTPLHAIVVDESVDGEIVGQFSESHLLPREEKKHSTSWCKPIGHPEKKVVIASARYVDAKNQTHHFTGAMPLLTESFAAIEPVHVQMKILVGLLSVAVIGLCWIELKDTDDQ